MTDAPPAFLALSKLFRGDEDKVRRALEVFWQVTRSDLERLDEAHARGDWVTIARLMHRMKSACQQIGEVAATHAAVSVEDSLRAGDGGRAMAYAVARDELGAVQDRVEQYLGTEHGRGQAECGS